jgi:branched-chain amino acid transport system substrate-binding protein
MGRLEIGNQKLEIGNRGRCTQALSFGVLFILGCMISSCAGLLGSTGPVVKIGLVAPFEGLHRHLGYEVLYAVKLAVRERNAVGGVSSYMVELVALDDGNDPAQAPLQARKMIVDPDVMGVIGHFSDEAALAALDEYHRVGLALITQVAADTVTGRCYPEFFRLYARNELLGMEAARHVVKELGMRRLAVLRGRDDLAEAFLKAAELLGATVVLDTDASEQDWLAALKAASPELIFFSGGAVEGAELITQVREAGIEAIFMGGSGLDGSYLAQIGGEAVRGTLYITAAPRIEELVNSGDFVTGYQALAGRLPGPQAIMAYDATRVLLEALARAIECQGRPTRSAVVTELGALQNYLGLTGPITFDDKGDLVAPKMYVYRIEL